MNKVNQSSQSTQIEENSNEPFFSNRFLEFAAVNITTVGANIGTYFWNLPSSLYDRLVTEDSITNDLITSNLKKIRSSDTEETMNSLTILYEAYDKASSENQITIIREMVGMLYELGSSKEERLLIGQKLTFLACSKKLQDTDKFKAFIDECIGLFETIANNNAETEKFFSLAIAFDSLKLLLKIHRNCHYMNTNKQVIDRAKLHASLNNLRDSIFYDDRISEIKKELPLTIGEEI